jgi:taurine dioxygenase
MGHPDEAKVLATQSAPIEVIRRGATMAAEIKGVDFSRPVAPETAAAIHAALMQHKIIYFRNADMTPEQQVAFGRQFGELTVHPFTAHLPHLPEVMLLDNDENNPVFATDIWHSDETFRVEPPMGSILRCLKIPQTGGDTLWVDTCAAWEGLSDKMQQLLSGLEAIHDFKPFRRKFDSLPIAEKHRRLAEMEEALPNPAHPLARTHPVTGKKALFVNEQFTIAIKGMHADESRALLDLLFAQMRIPEYQFRFAWQPNSMVFWDNRPTQHYAANDYYPQPRLMHRVTIKGDKPF